jgi:hypothetical protein
MKSGIKTRLAKLEAAAPEPPSPFDGMTADELRAWLLDEAERLLACDDISEEHRAWLKQLLVAGTASNGVVNWNAITSVDIPLDL